MPEKDFPEEAKLPWHLGLAAPPGTCFAKRICRPHQGLGELARISRVPIMHTQQHPKLATPPGTGPWGTDTTLGPFHCSQTGTDLPWLTALLRLSCRNPCCSRDEAVIWCETSAPGHIVH